MLQTGVDLIEIKRINLAIERHGSRFLKRIFTNKELALFGKNIPSLASRFAGKEAVSKALCTGIGDIEWQEIEILRGAEKEPLLLLHGEAKRIAAKKNLTVWSISLSHTHEYAIATVVALEK